MIERVLEADRLFAVGLLDQAERLYAQVAQSDPRNAFAVVGLAKVALERGDEVHALELAERALDIDPENVQARRIADRLGTSRPPPGTPTAAPDTPLQPERKVGRLRRWLRRG